MKPFKSVLALVKKFPNDKTCRAYLEHLRWGDTPACPFCGSTNSYNFPSEKRYRCKDCKKKYSATVGTIFENTKVPLQKWFIAIYLLSAHKKGISSLQLSRDIDVTQKTAWFILHRVREMLSVNDPQLFNSMVEVDETFVGGKRSNKHANKKKHNGASGWFRGEKTAVIGLVERNGKVISYPIPSATKNVVEKQIEKHVVKGSRVITDDSIIYHQVHLNYNHTTINHTAKQYVVGDVHTNTIEGYFSLLKRGLIGIYHQVSPKHLHRYCTEFSYRYNTRKDCEDERFADVIVKSDNKRLKYADLIANRN